MNSIPSLPRKHGRMKFRDSLTFDMARSTRDGAGNHMGRKLARPCVTHDGRTVDSTGAFLLGELERLDPKMHEPLFSVTYGRDIDMREDVALADEVSSFTLSTYGAGGGLGTGNVIGNGKSWAGKATDQIAGIGLDIAKVPHPLTIWAMELKYSIPELESSAQQGRPIDQQKFNGIKTKHQMDTDEQVYFGDSSLGLVGLVNNDVSRGGLVSNVTTVSGGQWTSKTPAQILQDVNEIVTSGWSATGYAVMPQRILLPPSQFGYISTQTVSTAGNMSILKYVQENSVHTTTGNGKLEILPTKWCVGAGIGGTIGTPGTSDRMIAYTKDIDKVRFPMTMLQRTPVQFDSIYHKSTYFCRLGVVEVVYPECIAYRDGV